MKICRLPKLNDKRKGKMSNDSTTVQLLKKEIDQRNPGLMKWRGLTKIYTLATKYEKMCKHKKNYPEALWQKYSFLLRNLMDIRVLVVCGHAPFVSSYSCDRPYHLNHVGNTSKEHENAIKTLERCFKLQGFRFNASDTCKENGVLWITVSIGTIIHSKDDDAAVDKASSCYGTDIIQTFLQYVWQQVKPFVICLGREAKTLADECIIGRDKKSKVRAYSSIVYLPLPYHGTNVPTNRMYNTPFLHMANEYVTKFWPETALSFSEAGSDDEDGF